MNNQYNMNNYNYYSVKDNQQGIIKTYNKFKFINSYLSTNLSTNLSTKATNSITNLKLEPATQQTRSKQEAFHNIII